VRTGPREPARRRPPGGREVEQQVDEHEDGDAHRVDGPYIPQDAASYGTDLRVAFAESARADADADEQVLEAASTENFEKSAFNAWLVTDLLGDEQSADVARARFTPTLELAFDAWIALDPATNAHFSNQPRVCPSSQTG